MKNNIKRLTSSLFTDYSKGYTKAELIKVIESMSSDLAETEERSEKIYKRYIKCMYLLEEKLGTMGAVEEALAAVEEVLER